jgi:hypothetical protein
MISDIISSPNTEIGAIVELYYSPIFDIVSIPQPNADHQVTESEIEFNFYGFKKLDILPDTGILESETNEGEHGQFFKTFVKATITTTQKKDFVILKQLKRFVLKAKLGNGDLLLIGNQIEYGILANNNSIPKKRSALQQVELQFNFQHKQEIPSLV